MGEGREGQAGRQAEKQGLHGEARAESPSKGGKEREMPGTLPVTGVPVVRRMCVCMGKQRKERRENDSHDELHGKYIRVSRPRDRLPVSPQS